MVVVGGGCSGVSSAALKSEACTRKRKRKKKTVSAMEGEKSRESSRGRMFRMKTTRCCDAQVCAGSPQTPFALTAAR